jgi:hypothetical protein
METAQLRNQLITFPFELQHFLHHTGLFLAHCLYSFHPDTLKDPVNEHSLADNHPAADHPSPGNPTHDGQADFTGGAYQ